MIPRIIISHIQEQDIVDFTLDESKSRREDVVAFYKYVRKVREIMADRCRNLLFTSYCPVFILVFSVKNGSLEHVTKLLLFKSNYYVYAFYCGGHWKFFSGCLFTLLVLKKCKELVLKLVFLFVESAKFARIYQFVRRIILEEPKNFNTVTRDTWVLNQWAKISGWLYDYFLKDIWPTLKTHDDFFKMPKEKDLQLKRCMELLKFIKRPSLKILLCDLKSVTKIIFEFSTDTSGQSLVRKYKELVTCIRSMGKYTVMDVDNGVTTKCSFLLFREDFDFCAIKVIRKWLSLFTSPYALRLRKMYMREGWITTQHVFVTITFCEIQPSVQSGDISHIHNCDLLFFIFFFGAIFPEIESLVRLAFLSGRLIKIPDYYFRLLPHWMDLSQYLQLNDHRRSLPRKISAQLILPRFHND